jgi:hypothetical protein
MASSTIECREARVTPRETSRRLREAYSDTLGSLVAAFNKLPLNPQGKLVEDWETRILCSNPRGASQEATEEAAKEAGKKLPASNADASANDVAKLPGDEVFDAEWWAEASKDNELQPVRLCIGPSRASYRCKHF